MQGTVSGWRETLARRTAMQHKQLAGLEALASWRQVTVPQDQHPIFGGQRRKEQRVYPCAPGATSVGGRCARARPCTRAAGSAGWARPPVEREGMQLRKCGCSRACSRQVEAPLPTCFVHWRRPRRRPCRPGPKKRWQPTPWEHACMRHAACSAAAGSIAVVLRAKTCSVMVSYGIGSVPYHMHGFLHIYTMLARCSVHSLGVCMRAASGSRAGARGSGKPGQR